MAKIRILFIDVRADLGGGSKHLQAILKNLNREKIEIYVACPISQALSDEFKSAAQEFIQIPFRHFSLKTFFSLKRFAERNRINFIHSHGKGAGIYSRVLSYLTEIPTIHTFHGVSDVGNSLQSRVSLWVERFLAFQTARFIHVSESEQKFACNLGISDLNRSIVIRNGIDLNRFVDKNHLRLDVRKELGYQENHFVIGCVARFDSCKRHEDLILAFNRLILKHNHARLLLVGAGEREFQIKQLISEKALGSYVQVYVPKENIESIYAALDVFVLPSLHEGLPLAPIEAMASGCPVILTNVRGNQDVVTDQETGLLTPVSNPEALASAIESLIQNRDLRSKLATSGQRQVRADFNQADMIDKTQKLYFELCPIPEIRNVALVHDWLFHMRGGEKVLEAIGELLPTAPVYTLFLNESKLSNSLRKHRLIPSCLNYLPKVEKYYRYLLPLLPFVMGRLNLSKFDLVISSSHCVAKGARKSKKGIHICYCHAPMRYVWGFSQEYFGSYSKWKQKLVQMITGYLKKWDLMTNRNIDYFVANSENVRTRIKQFYNREANVIYPPIDVRTDQKSEVGVFYLVVSALVPYKRVDLAVNAFNIIGAKLIVIGDGPLFASLKSRATDNIEFLGWQEDSQVINYYQKCKALIFPTEEDFGMVPVEAMMCGKPVIAFGKGGALETVLPAKNPENSKQSTGVLFDEQTVDSLIHAIKRFESYQFDPEFIRSHAMKFTRTKFVAETRNFLLEKVTHHG